MTPHASELPADLLCERCGYDLRAQRHDAACPECGTSVAASRQSAGIPRRPAWRSSDPRWRRRMLAGAWVLTLLPLVDVSQAAGWAAAIPTWTPFDFRGTVRVLDDTLLFSAWVYPPLVFCIGVVLLFSKERGRRPSRLDWTRRWGVICSYVTFLLAAAPVLFIGALVLVGIGALYLSMPPRYQPPVTKRLVDVSAAYLRYGPQPTDVAGVVQVAFSSVAVLLACVPLFDALRSSGPKTSRGPPWSPRSPCSRWCNWRRSGSASAAYRVRAQRTSRATASTFARRCSRARSPPVRAASAGRYRRTPPFPWNLRSGVPSSRWRSG